MNPKPSLFKKIIYILLTVVLCFLLSIIVHVGLEIVFYNYLLASHLPVLVYHTPVYGESILPIAVQLFLLDASVICGVFLGLFWWRMVYIEHRHWHSRKK